MAALAPARGDALSVVKTDEEEDAKDEDALWLCENAIEDAYACDQSQAPNDQALCDKAQRNMQLFRDQDMAVQLAKKEKDDLEKTAACTVCDSTTSTTSNPLMFCDGHDCKQVAWHKECLNLHNVPEGDWFCFMCRDDSAGSSGGGKRPRLS